jgi:radical SAM/Cys-rich protein
MLDSIPIVEERPVAAGGTAPRNGHEFVAALERHRLDLHPRSITILQVNLTKTCNQACRHCHVDSSPARTERLSRAGVDALLDVLARHPQITGLDLTGGAPELHPDFDEIAERAVALGKHVMVRHNLTVQFDGHPQTGQSKAYLPELFARLKLEVICSLPYYQSYFTDSQRGKGVFDKSIEGLRRLNALGYGVPDSGRALNLVYNPAGAFLPAAQAVLEADFKRELQERFGIVFNQLFTITNMPINRFKQHLQKADQYRPYMDKLLGAFNPTAAENVMCRDLISVGCDGRLFDCDFNQQMEMDAEGGMTLFDFDYARLMQRRIRFDDHCLGCTAGAGSSCGGATT